MEKAFARTRAEDADQRLPRHLMTVAEAALDEIERDDPQRVVLHGDLHQENVLLDAAGGWLAIDPKGVVGPACYEVARFLNNRVPDELPDDGKVTILEARMRVLERELGHSRRLLACAGLVDNVLGHCWGLEEETLGSGWHRGLHLATLFQQML